MHPLVTLLIALAALITLALWWPVELRAQARLELPHRAEGVLCIRFFSGLIRLEYRLAANILDSPSFQVLGWRKGRQPQLVWQAGQRWERAQRMRLPIEVVWRQLRLKKLHVEGRLGIRGDAFASVMLSGALGAILQGALIAACSGKRQSALYTEILPDFTRDCLRLNLEGIAGCPPIHIIIAIMIWRLKNREGRKKVWHILSKTS